MLRCRKTRQHSSLCFINDLNSKSSNKKAEGLSAFYLILQKTSIKLRLLSSAQTVQHLQTNEATYQLSFPLFGKSQQDVFQP